MRSLSKLYDYFCIKFLGIFRGETGQTLVEYGLLLVLIAIVVLFMLKGTGQQINSTWSMINSGINQ
jgi:Flp pilus assembly pilin Flp